MLLVEHFSVSLVSVNPDVWCWDVCYITLCNWKTGSLDVGLQAEIMTSSQKRGLGCNEEPNGILDQSLGRTWKEPGLLLRHIHSLAECFYPMPPTYCSSTKNKQVRQAWFTGRWAARLWTQVDTSGNGPNHPFPTVVQTTLTESEVVRGCERPCGFSAVSSTYCIHSGSSLICFLHCGSVNDSICNLLLLLK